MIRVLFSFIFSIGLIVALNSKIAPIPPLGKFLDPFHGFWANARQVDDVPGQITMPGLEAEVSALYDDMLVPHIFATSDYDLYAATGFVHASNRLWQMEIQTHAAAGRLSEIAGEVTLDMDRGQRRKGMVFGAENFIAHLDDTSKMILNAYADGVNAFINRLDYEQLPFEYKLLNYAPESWTVLKSGLLYKYMADMLNSSERDMENTNFLQLYGREMLDLIYPDVDNYQDPVIDVHGDWGFDALKKSPPATEVRADLLVRLDKLPQPDPNNGSNNWAVSSQKSATGHALLCNDMHLSLYMPSLWYYIQQQSTGVNVYGHSLPGIPIVITGFTDSIAWGFTNAQRDLVDWYKITYENESRDRYLLDGTYVPVTKRIEEIKIRGKESYYDTVAYTVFGPVTYDNYFKATSQKNGYAYRWIDHDPLKGINMFYLMNRAKNFQDYMNALDHFATPAQNVVFASVQGDIAHKVQGKYPMNDVEEGKFIKDGSSASNNWQEYIPAVHNAFWKNPDRGFVSSANQHPADSTYPYYITGRSFEAYRNRRINNVLRAESTITIDDMKSLQYDNYSMKAAESLPIMLDLLNGQSLTAEEIALIETFGQWDYFFTPESESATMYDIWYETLYTEVWDEISNSGKENIPLAYPTDYSTINLLKTHPENVFFDHNSTTEVESARDIVLMSFREMIQKIKVVQTEKGSIRWADVKSTYIEHQLRIKPLGFYDITTSGNGGDVVNATGRNHGPSERIIVELDPAGVKAWGHYPGGQSGNPGSKYYDNMVLPWANGEYFDLLFLSSPEARSNRILYTQKINK
jgi:penicillin amidase